MNKIYFTSDLHLCHDREFVWGVRGFKNVDEMNKAIVKNWNDVVDWNDDVYVLGDLMLGDTNSGMKLLNQLNGRIHVILGNHDTATRKALYQKAHNVVEVCDVKYFNYNKYHFYLSHYHTETSNITAKSLDRELINLYGHTHQKTSFWEDIPMYYHVGVDSHDCKPILIEDIIEEIENKAKECLKFC